MFTMRVYGNIQTQVALLAEGVDRNTFGLILRLKHSVALLAEGVDRNLTGSRCKARTVCVALLAEGVDRNVDIANDLNSRGLSRPPRGGRG